ncbi:MAG: M23 family metallopeptidase [Anaerolineales bacterium]
MGDNSPDMNTSPPGWLEQVWHTLRELDLTAPALRLSAHLLTLLVVLLIAFGMRWFYNQSDVQARFVVQASTPQPTASPLPLPDFTPQVSALPLQSAPIGLQRAAAPDTASLEQARTNLVQYTVQPGDTVIGLASRFGLQPATILLANADVLYDNPHNLRAGQVLFILPVDGALYEWNTGDSLNTVAQFYNVSAQSIVNWRGNGLNTPDLGDWNNPNIPAGKRLVIPQGQRAYVRRALPNLERANSAQAAVLGAGACSVPLEGPLGSETFIFPTVSRALAGYPYAPNINHWGIDLTGSRGDPVFATDAGVVMYAGLSSWGAGYWVWIDHGNGWQSLYTHLNSIVVSCGAFVTQGMVIGSIGDDANGAPYIHFELRHKDYGTVNPADFLQ